MEISEFVNFETSCSCEVCSECQIKKLSDFITTPFGGVGVELNYLENYDNYIKKANIRPEECCLFEKYQLFDILNLGYINYDNTFPIVSMSKAYNKYK